jgi:multicomponent Na+:H+ antiporter subunit D
MVVYSAGMWHQPLIWLLLEGASIGTFLHTGLKLPWGVWFAGKEPVCEAREPPKNMLAAMGLTAFLCTLLGVYPKILYDMLPYPVHYEPYAVGHVVTMSQLLLFTFVAFWLLRGMLHGTPTITLDTDWFYRIPGKRVIWFCQQPLMTFASFIDRNMLRMAGFFINPFFTLIVKYVDNPVDKLFHGIIPAIPGRVTDMVRYIRTESGVLAFNVIYILLFYIFVLLLILVVVL